VEPETLGVPSVAPVEASVAVSALSVAVTTAGTLAFSVVTIADAVPIVTVPVGAELALAGHTRIPLVATVAVSRRRVGVTMNVSVVDAAAPVYVAENDPAVTLVASALKDPVDDTSALAGVTAPKVTGTTTAEPETSVSPVANVPRLTVVASTTAGIALVVSVVVCPSGAVTTTRNCTEPDAGATEPSVYVPIDAECAALLYVYVGVVPYAVEVPELTHVTAPLLISVVLLAVASNPVSVSTIELVFPAPHTTEPAVVP
jgi:hypothetical protein